MVLSSVSYYLNIPISAYLTEDEVLWRVSDAIPLLKYNPGETSTVQQKRQEWEEITDELDPSKGLMGTDTIVEVWEELEEEVAGDGQRKPFDAVSTAAEEIDEWDVDGMGTGVYWMKKDWNGTVRDTDSWERLFNVTTR